MQGPAARLTDEQNNAIRERIRRLLETNSQEEVATSTGISQSAISRFLAGKQGTSLTVGIKAITLCGEDWQEILGIGGGGASSDDALQSPKEAAIAAFRSDAVHADGHELAEVDEFLEHVASKSFAGARSSVDWWLVELRDSFRMWRRSRKDGADHPFGVGARKL